MFKSVAIVSLFVIAIWYGLTYDDGMAVCQQTHSFDTCHHALYR